MRHHLQAALTATLVVGAAVGATDGWTALSSNAYQPAYALLFLTLCIVVTTVALGLLAAGLAVMAWRRGRSAERLAATLVTQLVAVVAVTWCLLAWRTVAARAWAGGGGWLIVLTLPLPVAFGVGIAAAVRALLGRADPRRLARGLRWAGAAGGVVVALSIGFLASLWTREHYRLAFDSERGRPRQAGELNVLLITLDTLRADRLATDGGRAGLTPALDRLAAGGVAFTTAISQSPWTLPSVASMLTGLTPASHGAGYSANAFDILARTPLPEGTWTLPQALRAQGYVTRAFVTNPFLSTRYGFGRGFDGYENLSLESEIFLGLADTRMFRFLTTVFRRLRVVDIGEAVTVRAERWLARHHDEKFFLWLHYLDIHAPYGDPRRLGTKTFRGDLVAADGGHDGSGNLGDRFDAIARLRSGEIRLDAAQRQQLQRLYDIGVRYDDDQVGLVLRQLDRLGLREHTLIVVASDHGEEFWEHGGVEHGHTVYDELVRVPLILQWPGGPSGLRIDGVVRLMDIAPTVVDLVGAGSVPATMEGRSVRPLLTGQPETPRVALSESLLFADERQGLRSGHFEYIRWADGKEEVYDLANDPGERRDLAARDELLASLRAQLQELVRAQPPSRGPVVSPDAATVLRLRQLGYLQ